MMAATLLAALLVAASPDYREVLQISGYAWEDGGFAASEVGDRLYMVGVVNDVDKPLVWDTSNHSYTLWIRDLVSQGEVVFGTTRVVSYTGGRITIGVDSAPSNHEYGVNPPNATVPLTFVDGSSIYLDGVFTDCFLTFNGATQSGSWVAGLSFTDGDALFLLPHPQFCDASANIANVAPDGYDLQMNGGVRVLMSVAVEPASWGAVKALYR